MNINTKLIFNLTYSDINSFNEFISHFDYYDDLNFIDFYTNYCGKDYCAKLNDNTSNLNEHSFKFVDIQNFDFITAFPNINK